MIIPAFEPIRFEVIDSLAPIALRELQQEAAFLTRRDRKYIVPTEALGELLGTVEAGSRALEISEKRIFSYSTRYFDDAHVAYYRVLRQRADRFKVRTRRYDDSGECLLEVKLLDGRGRTVKSRFPHEDGNLETLSSLDRAWLQSFTPVRSVARHLAPSVATHYRRSTLVFPNGSGRMTIDQGLTFIGGDEAWCRLDGLCVVETKGAGHPQPFDRRLWKAGYRPVPASKFALGVCLTNPELPDNRWHRLRGRLERSISRAEA